MEFRRLLAPHKGLIGGLISALDKRAPSYHLLPSSASVPPDAEYRVVLFLYTLSLSLSLPREKVIYKYIR